MSSLSDIVGGADLYNGVSYSFTTDRFGNANRAIYLNNGYLQVPPGVYFSGDFTVTAWINLKSYSLSYSFSPIFGFGSNSSGNNVFLALRETYSLQTCILIGNIWPESYSCVSSNAYIQPNVWYHVAVVLSGTTRYFYLNGNLFDSGTLYVPNSVTRDSN